MVKFNYILENIPYFSIDDIELERDYPDGRIEDKGSEEISLNIPNSGGICIEFNVTVVKEIGVFSEDHDEPITTNIYIEDLKMYEHGVEKDLNPYKYGRILKVLNKINS